MEFGKLKASKICLLSAFFQGFIAYPLYDVYTAGEDCIRYLPIFAVLSTLFTGLLSFTPNHAPTVKGPRWIATIAAISVVVVLLIVAFIFLNVVVIWPGCVLIKVIEKY